MNAKYQIKLTSKDLYVLSSLLKKEFIVGVEGLTLVQEIPFQREGIHFVVNSLEDRGWIRYDLNGTLMVDPRIRYVIDVISNPQKVSMVNKRGGKKKRAPKYFFFDKEGVIELYRDLQDGHYEIRVSKPVSREEFDSELMSSFISNRELVCKEHILLEELMLVKDHIKEFRENEGREYLKRTVHNEVSMDVIMEILRGRIESAVVRRYERKGYRLELLSSNIFVKTGEFSAEMNCEDNVVVSVSIYKDEKGDQK